MLAKVNRVSYRILPDTPVASPRRMFTLPEAFDVHFYFRCPQALAIDSGDVRLTVADAKGRRAEQRLRIPIRYYQQKTSLTLSHSWQGRYWVGLDHERRPRRLLECLCHRHRRLGSELCSATKRR